MEPAIRVENLGKLYRVTNRGERANYATLRETVMHAAGAPLRWARQGFAKPDPAEDFWALKGVDFEVMPGEVVGVIGRNGAGKSTLLKILSRITKPTTGRVTLNGRVGSLLEVGTGFHPELTGRENVYLNGSILGMSRREIAKKFDEIVAFAEVERFLDTPVKRYSSGMYVRLAFAVAAHLEPEILIVDEVLAVGDAAFQDKCVGKMQEASSNGRTVIFVSHHLPTVLKFCDRVIWLANGLAVEDGQTATVVDHYTTRTQSARQDLVDLRNLWRTPGVRGGASFTECQLMHSEEGAAWCLDFRKPFHIEVAIESKVRLATFEIGLVILSSLGVEVVSPVTSDDITFDNILPGKYRVRISLPNLMLNPGTYSLGLGLRSEMGFEDFLHDVTQFEIKPTEESAKMGLHNRRGSVVPEIKCSLLKV